MEIGLTWPVYSSQKAASGASGGVNWRAHVGRNWQHVHGGHEEVAASWRRPIRLFLDRHAR